MYQDHLIRKTCVRHNIAWQAHELTFSCYCRRAFLTRDRTRLFLADAIAAAKEKHPFHLWAYVIMPEHVHLLVWPVAEVYDTSSFLHAMKQSVARKALIYLRRENPQGLRWLATGQKHAPYRFWQDGGGYDRNLTSRKAILASRDYIENNPVKRGLVRRAEDWEWSSCRQWAGLANGPIVIDKPSFIESTIP